LEEETKNQMINFLRSVFWKYYLRIKGATVGDGFVTLANIDVICRDDSTLKNLTIGRNVQFNGKVYIRLRRNGRIIIEDNVAIGHEVWLACANDSELRIRKNCLVGPYCIFNGGHGIDIGEDTWFAAFVYLNSSDHNMKLGQLIREQGYTGAPIKLGSDNWVAGHVSITKGVTTGRGVVIGAGTVVTHNFDDNSVVVGNPGRLLKYRN
jgi:acetyltransferase-like isoleucine patch superfamily enzyme